MHHINSVFHCPFFYFPYLLHKPSARTSHAKSGCNSSQLGSHQTLEATLWLCLGNLRSLKTVSIADFVHCGWTCRWASVFQELCIPPLLTNLSFFYYYSARRFNNVRDFYLFFSPLYWTLVLWDYFKIRVICHIIFKPSMLVKKTRLHSGVLPFPKFWVSLYLFCFRLNIYRLRQSLLLYCHSNSTSKVIFFFIFLKVFDPYKFLWYPVIALPTFLMLYRHKQQMLGILFCWVSRKMLMLYYSLNKLF